MGMGGRGVTLSLENLGCCKRVVDSGASKRIWRSSPLPALRQQRWDIKAERTQFQSCDFSAAKLVVRKIISEFNVQCFSQITFNSVEL